MSSIYGIWKQEMASGDSSVTTTQTLRKDGSYETHMVYRPGDGCRQHIRHYGDVTIGETTLRLTLASVTTEMTGCEDPSKDFDLRDFTPAELEEARALLAQDIEYAVDGDTLTTTLRGPMGPMEVVYERQEE